LRVMRQHSPEQINLRLSTELRAKVEAKCNQMGIDRSAGCRLALQAWVDGVTPVTSTAAPEGYEEVLSALVAKIAAIEEGMQDLMAWRETADKCIDGIPQLVAAVERANQSPQSAPSAETTNRMAELLSKLQK
jgi:antitoxin component of RelBE/YafQ-DinJ toxin-antitoxin module